MQIIVLKYFYRIDFTENVEKIYKFKIVSKMWFNSVKRLFKGMLVSRKKKYYSPTSKMC